MKMKIQIAGVMLGIVALACIGGNVDRDVPILPPVMLLTLAIYMAWGVWDEEI